MNIKGIGRKKIELLLKEFSLPENVFNAERGELLEVCKNYKFFTEEDLSNLIITRDEQKIVKYYSRLKSSGVSYISIENSDYPTQLLNIYDPPYILYYRGEIPNNDSIRLAIVGARKCSSYGKKVAEYLGKKLAENNITVVSGMARGIDSAAHFGSLSGNGKTIAVLGCGVNICYPKENEGLMKSIINNGCVMSETPVNAAPVAGNFPLRNRIISGLCDGVIVVEAAVKSGSLITADSALEQGKDVFAVPGRLFDRLSEGTNHLLKLGAKVVTDVDDILEEYIELKSKENENYTQMKLFDRNEETIYTYITFNPIHLDALCRMAEMKIDDLQLALMKLELSGMIEQLPNKYYIRRV